MRDPRGKQRWAAPRKGAAFYASGLDDQGKPFRATSIAVILDLGGHGEDLSLSFRGDAALQSRFCQAFAANPLHCSEQRRFANRPDNVGDPVGQCVRCHLCETRGQRAKLILAR